MPVGYTELHFLYSYNLIRFGCAVDPLDELGSLPSGALNAADNPFVARDGAVPPAFGGRDAILRDARVDLGQLRAGRPAARRTIEGLRGTGKTALMARVRQAASMAEIAVAHIEADPGGDPIGDATDELKRAATSLLPASKKIRRSVEHLTSLKVGPGGVELTWTQHADHRLVHAIVVDTARLARHVKRGLFITLDEAHEAESTLLKPVLKALHRVDQDGLPGGGWIAGLPGTVTNLIKEGQTYAERIVVHEIGLLNAAEVEAALLPPFSKVGISVDPGVVERVTEESGGYPFFVQAWGEALWSACRNPGRVDSADAATAAPAARSRADDLMRSRWQRLTEASRRYAWAMVAQPGQGPFRTADVAAQLDRSLSQAGPQRAALIEAGVAMSVGYGLIDFTVPGFTAWLRRHQPSG